MTQLNCKLQEKVFNRSFTENKDPDDVCITAFQTIQGFIEDDSQINITKVPKEQISPLEGI